MLFSDRVCRFYVHGLLVGAALVTGCKAQEQGFTGGSGTSGGRKPQPAEAQDQTKEEPAPLPKPKECTEAELESVNSLKSFVSQDHGFGTLELELNFQPCPAQVGRVQLPILFDIDANTRFLAGYERRLSYEVSIQGVRVAGPGPVTPVFGQDLFGKQGSEFAHFKSEGALSVAPNVSMARLTVKLLPLYVMGPVNNSKPATSNFSVPIYVKVGQSNPVKVNVQFSPANIPP